MPVRQLTPEELKAQQKTEFVGLCTMGGFIGMAIVVGIFQAGQTFVDAARNARRKKEPWELY